MFLKYFLEATLEFEDVFSGRMLETVVELDGTLSEESRREAL